MKQIMKNKWMVGLLQGIAKHWAAWLLILLTALLGAAAILGTDGAARSVKLSASEFYEAQKLRNVSITASHLFSPEDLEVIRSTEGVKDAEAVWQTQAKAREEGQDICVTSLTERISLTLTSEGRLPIDETECAVESALCESCGWKIGDVIRLCDENGNVPQYLRETEYRIVGTAVLPELKSSDASGAGCVLVTPGAFDLDALENCAMKVEILVEDGADRFSEEHRALTAAVRSRLEELAPARIALRDEAVRIKGEQELEEGRKQLDADWKTLEADREKLDLKQKDLEADQKSLKSEEEKLPAVLQKLNADKAALDAAQKQLEETKKGLEEAKKQLEEPKKQLEESRKKLDETKKKLSAEKEKLDGRADELAQDKNRLASDFASLEKKKAGIRSAIRQVIENAYGGSTGNLISWASEVKPDVNGDDANAEEIRFTAGYHAGTSKSWKQVIEGFVYSSAIPDEVLVRIYRNMKDDPHAEPDLKEVREFLYRQALNNSSDEKSAYESLQPACTKWTSAHKEYLTARADYKKAQGSYQEKKTAHEADETAYKTAEEEYNKSAAEIEAGEKKAAETEKANEKSLKEYEAAMAKYDQDAKAVEAHRKAMEEAEKAQEEAEAQYAKDKAACEDGEIRLTEAKAALENMAEGTWTPEEDVQDAGFAAVQKENGRLKGYAVVSALLFPVALALVVYAAVSRMVLEQRSIVKNTRVTAEYKKDVWIGYLIFGGTAVLLGIILGILLARFLIVPLLMKGAAAGLGLGLTRRTLGAGAVILVLLLGLLLAETMISIACLRPMQKTGNRTSGKAPQESEEKKEKNH